MCGKPKAFTPAHVHTNYHRVDLPGRQGLTPLHCAARAGRAGLVRTLLAAGASPSARDPCGRTLVCVYNDTLIIDPSVY